MILSSLDGTYESGINGVMTKVGFERVAHASLLI
jgi:hypothetical protein